MAKILIIEDNVANIKLASMLIRHAGHVAQCAGDAELALAMVKVDPPDLILMDIQLPGMDGLAATRILKREPETSGIPIIALTAMAMQEDRDRTISAGCDACIIKPLRYQELYGAIDALLLARAP